jgi:hypothetical protein
MNQDYLIKKYNLDVTQPNPIWVPQGGRNEIVDLWRELGFKVGVEVGVQKGNFAEQMCKAIPGLKYYGVDAWTDYAGYRDINASRRGQEGFDQIYEETKLRVAPYDATLIKNWSVDAAKDFEDGSLDFVYIDANHEFEHVTEDIAAWSKKIKKDGIICGHDYARINKDSLKLHVKDAVDGWVNSHEIKPLFVFLKDHSPNWLFFV